MKRLLVVLFGVLVFQGSVWAAKCDEMTAKVLSPGTGSVLLKRLPFVLQWQDDDLCLGKQVTIGLVSVGEQKTFISYTGDKRDHKRKRENSGYLLIEKLKAPESGDQQYQFIIARGKVAVGGESIQSEPFSVRRTKQVVDGRSALEAGVRDLVIRIAALEATVKALEGGGGDSVSGVGQSGGSFTETTGDCRHDKDGLWADGMDWEKCKNVKWNAANGVGVATNPVCWRHDVKWDSGGNPWVVGTPAAYNSDAYGCRTECASALDLNYCATNGWWNLPAAEKRRCTAYGIDGSIEFHKTRARSGLVINRYGAEKTSACN